MYNLTNLTDASTAYDVAKFTNEVTNGSFWTMVIFAIFLVLLFSMKRYDIDKALLVSSWISFIISGLLSFASLVNIIIPLAFLATAGFMTLYVFMASKGQ